MRGIIVLYFLGVCMSFHTHSQKTHSIQLLAIPFTQKVGSMQKMYVSKYLPSVYADYLKSSWPEFGLGYRHGFNKKWDLNVGLSFQNATHKMIFQVANVVNYDSSPHLTNAKTTQQNLNLRLGIGYFIIEKIKINIGVSFNGGITSKSDFNSFEQTISGGSYSSSIYKHDYLMNIAIKRGNFNTLNIVPEISASFNIVDNLNLLVGFRFKFWNSKTYYYQATVTGFIGDENKGTTSVLHESNYTSKDYSVYFGLTYDVFLKKKHKIVD